MQERPFAPDFVPCEVQVRSRLQDAWAELSHDDIYKADGLAEELRARFDDLATTLAAADKIASGSRQRIAMLVTTPKHRPNLSRVTADGIAYLFSRTFGGLATHRQAARVEAWPARAVYPRAADTPERFSSTCTWFSLYLGIRVAERLASGSKDLPQIAMDGGEVMMNFSDKRLWYGVVAVIVVLLVIGYAAG